MFACCVCCVLSGRELITRLRGVLTTVVRHCVWSRNLVWQGHSPRWAAVPEKKISLTWLLELYLSLENLNL
jgi:hypothetical protein